MSIEIAIEISIDISIEFYRKFYREFYRISIESHQPFGLGWSSEFVCLLIPFSPSGSGLPLPLAPPPGVGTGVSRGVAGSFLGSGGPVSLMMVQDGLRWLQDGKIKLPGAVQAWQKWHPVEARRRFSAKCMLPHRCLQDGSKMAQERPKRASRDVFSCPRGVIELWCPRCLGRWPQGWHKDGPR